MFQSISWFGGGRFAGFSDDEIRTIVEGAAVRARKRMPAVRQEPWRSATPRGKRNLKRKAA
jgi:hypothetical protein